jgi:hypothetical protein
MIDPSILFSWPFVRVLLVFFDGFGERKISDAEALAKINEKRAAKGLALLDKLPFRSGSNGPTAR